MTDQSGPAPNTEHQRTQALEQITLISRVLEGFESEPKAHPRLHGQRRDRETLLQHPWRRDRLEDHPPDVQGRPPG
jgi:hypothetical protein